MFEEKLKPAVGSNPLDNIKSVKLPKFFPFLNNATNVLGSLHICIKRMLQFIQQLTIPQLTLVAELRENKEKLEMKWF